MKKMSMKQLEQFKRPELCTAKAIKRQSHIATVRHPPKGQYPEVASPCNILRK